MFKQLGGAVGRLLFSALLLCAVLPAASDEDTDVWCLSELAEQAENSLNDTGPMPVIHTANSGTKTFLVLNGISSGTLIAPELRSRGHRVYHAWGKKPTARQLAAFKASDYDYVFPEFLAGDQESLSRHIKEMGIFAAIPGADGGVRDAETLSFMNDLPSNEPATLGARTNKFEQYQAMGETAAHFTDAEEALRYLRKEWGGWRNVGSVILKPEESSGSDLIGRVHNDRSFRKHFLKIKNNPNQYGQANDFVLMMPFVEGISTDPEIGSEYAINGVVMLYEGELYVRFTDVWRYNKRIVQGRPPLYWSEDLLAYSEIPPEILTEVLADLERCGYQNSAFHAESILGADGKVHKMEISPRLYGDFGPALAREAIDYDQVTALADIYDNPQRFMAMAGKPYYRRKMAKMVNINNPVSARPLAVSWTHWDNELAPQLQSLYQPIIKHAPEGALVKGTNGLTDTLARIELLTDDDRILSRDYELVRQADLERRFWVVRVASAQEQLNQWMNFLRHFF